MLTQPQSSPEGFLERLHTFYDTMDASDPLGRVRAKAWDRFLQIGLPTRSTEVYRYVRLKHLFAAHYSRPSLLSVSEADVAKHLLPECRESFLVLVNGQYVPKLSNIRGLNSKVVVTTLCKSTHQYGAFLNNHWNEAIKTETDPFAALNAALHLEGLFIYVPPQCDFGPPVQIISIIHGNQLLSLPRIQLMLGKNSEATLALSSVHIQGSCYAVSQVSDLILEDNARLNYLQNVQGLASNACFFDAIRVRLKKDSVLKAVTCTDGAATVRHDSRVTLMGEGAEASLSGLWMLDEKREAHTNVLIAHEAPRCRSNQLYKGILADMSRSSFEGKILVQRAAQKTEAYQLNHNLLLSEGANADSKPNLEIFADDVKASHGATIGQLDADQLFYLKTRGLSDAEARSLLVFSFAKELIHQITIPSMRQQVIRQAETFLA